MAPATIRYPRTNRDGESGLAGSRSLLDRASIRFGPTSKPLTQTPNASTESLQRLELHAAQRDSQFRTRTLRSDNLHPTADWALRHTDPSRNVQHALFERIYDQQLQAIFRAERTANWWKVDVNANRHRLIRPETKLAEQRQDKIICLCHDVERGLGHLDSDPDFAQAAEKTSGASLTEMLRIENRMEIPATYNVVGRLVPSLREPIESAGHCLAFHSYDHQDFEHSAQLGRCRSIDYRLERLPATAVENHAGIERRKPLLLQF